MQRAPLFSVITPFMNVGPYLGEAIESVLAQTMDDWELLLVDDGSTDEGSAVARGYAEKHPGRIRVLEHPGHANRGISASRNLGRCHARGRWLASLDGDDVWVPKKLEEQARIVAEHPEVGLVMGSYRMWYSWKADAQGEDYQIRIGAPQDTVIDPPRLLEFLYPLGQGTSPSMNGVLVRADVAEQVGGWEDSFRNAYEDQAFLTKLYLVTPAYVSSSCWDDYRQRPGSCTEVDLGGEGYDRHRRRYLEWFETYLKERGLVGERAWQDLQRALLPYRHPSMVSRAKRVVRVGRRALGWVARSVGARR
jgi:glycosyltransferase involved in cell wall biosynthesis